MKYYISYTHSVWDYGDAELYEYGHDLYDANSQGEALKKFISEYGPGYIVLMIQSVGNDFELPKKKR